MDNERKSVKTMLRELWGRLSGKKALRVGGYSVLASVIVLAIAVALNVLVNALPSSWTQYDTTSSQVFSISEQTEGVLAALEEGNSLAEFRENMNDFLEVEGYEGITPYQAENIFRTNIQTAYNVGHYEQMTDPGVMKLRPYWQYDAVNDAHTRPSHLAMDGRVFPADSAVWDSWFPPNGFRCRCTVKTLSKRQVEARGLKVEQSAPGGVMPDPHFSTNPAKVRFTPDLKDYPEALVKAYQKREKESPSL